MIFSAFSVNAIVFVINTTACRVLRGSSSLTFCKSVPSGRLFASCARRSTKYPPGSCKLSGSFSVNITFSVSFSKRAATMAPTECEYGAWKSPITSSVAAGSGISFTGLERDLSSSKFSDTIYWLEQRPSEGGRNVVCSWDPESKKIVEWTPSEYNVKTKVHEYGGGAFCVFGGTVYFVNKADQRIYVQSSPEEPPRELTKKDKPRKFADLFYSEHFNCLFAVCEDTGVRDEKNRNEVDDGCEVKSIPDNYIVSIDPQSGKPFCVVSETDFYARPRVSSTGTLSWMEWKMPNMPWDETKIKWVKLENSKQCVATESVQELIIENPAKGVAATFPEVTNGGEILYISDENNWWNLCVTNEKQTTKRCVEKVDHDLGHPLWIFGMHPYSVAPMKDKDTDMTIALSYEKELIVLKRNSGSAEFTSSILPSGFKHHYYYIQAVSGGVYALGYDAKTPMTLFFVEFGSKKVTKIRASSEVDLQGYLSEPEEISFPTTNGEVAYGFFYPPNNRDFTAPKGSLPPLRVVMHGGPTSKSYAMLSLKVQFYTSRGFGILDVNYRGSSGYGREYRQKLNLKWGVSDVEDAIYGVKYLVDKGLVDKDKLCISGSSAGGLTVLNALLHHDVFKAGASHYGVTDLEALVLDTHKFELKYLDSMIGLYPEEKKVYEDRSPIHNKDKLKCPVIFFQGTDDFVVPPSQSEKMYEAVKSKGLPCAYVTFEGEGHGFTRKENIEKTLDGEYAFFLKVFGIDAAHVKCDIEIENMPPK